MLLRLALLLEILTVVVCIHCVYGRKIKPDIPTIVFCLVSMIILDIINTYKINNISTIVVYGMIFVYCLWEFKGTIAETVTNQLLFMIILTAIQFICMLFVEVTIHDNEVLRTVIGNTVVFLVCSLILPKLKLNKLVYKVQKRNGLVMGTMGVALMVVGCLLLQNKMYKGIQIEIFVFAIPAILLAVLLLLRWSSLKYSMEKMTQESEVNKTMQGVYVDLLTKIRLRQHEFKNHIATLFSLHYSYHTYEQLVQAQREYSGKVQYENRYNNLLLLEEGFLCGFLYGKFQEIEVNGVKIEYKIGTPIKASVLPIHTLIEMLGILLDNAAEAARDVEDKRIKFLVEDSGKSYWFTVSNVYQYVSYAEIEKWFQMGVSKKGIERGIGLYHLRKLCDEWKCGITCQNVCWDEKNWIMFRLEIDKEGHCME